jgi:beta-glucanase (GH16 family)
MVPHKPSPSPRTRRAVLVGGVALAAVAASVGVVLSASASVPPTPSGWTQIFAEDFNGAANSLPNSSTWRFSTGHNYPGGPPNWGTGEIQNYTASPSNVSLDGNGNLRITPLRDGAGNWTSARIETNRQNFKAPAGGLLRIEGRIQMPNVTGAQALGYWPAFWALGGPYRGTFNWPAVGEFDIMENVNGINAVWGVLHCGIAPGGPCNEFSGIGASRACPGSTCQSAFHTYTFEWDRSITPNQLRWYVDGQQYHSVSQGQFDATTWNNMTSHEGYFILLNVAMGGGFPAAFGGGPTANTIPGRPMVVDYVAAWTRGGSAPTTNPPPTTTNPPPPGGTRDAYAAIQAESFNAQSGVGVENTSDVGGGQNIGWLANGDWARYDGVNFGSSPPADFVARVASGASGGISGLIEVRIDNVNNPPIGSFALANTGGWQSWRSIPGNVGAVTGVHTVFLRFTSGQPADFVNVNWFHFRR